MKKILFLGVVMSCVFGAGLAFGETYQIDVLINKYKGYGSDLIAQRDKVVYEIDDVKEIETIKIYNKNGTNLIEQFQIKNNKDGANKVTILSRKTESFTATTLSIEEDLVFGIYKEDGQLLIQFTISQP